MKNESLFKLKAKQITAVGASLTFNLNKDSVFSFEHFFNDSKKQN